MNGTKGKMAEAFKELVCKKSFQKITISDIAKESAMTRCGQAAARRGRHCL